VYGQSVKDRDISDIYVAAFAECAIYDSMLLNPSNKDYYYLHIYQNNTKMRINRCKIDLKNI